MAIGTIVNQAHRAFDGIASLMGVVGTLGTADTSGTALTLPVGVDPLTGGLYVYNLGPAGTTSSNLSSGTITTGTLAQVGTVLGIGGTVQVAGFSSGTNINMVTGTINSGTINLGSIVGNAASGATDSGNPVKVGFVYQGTAPIGTSGQRLDGQADVNGNLKVTQATLLAGEDLVNNVLKVEQRFLPSYISAAGTTTVKSGAGFVHSFVLGNTTAAAGTLYDGTATGTNIIWAHKASLAEGAYPLNVTFSTGLTYANPGTPQVMISYR